MLWAAVVNFLSLHVDFFSCNYLCVYGFACIMIMHACDHITIMVLVPVLINHDRDSSIMRTCNNIRIHVHAHTDMFVYEYVNLRVFTHVYNTHSY